MKKSIQAAFDTCIMVLNSKIDIEKVEDPNSWELISKVAVIVDDYVKI
jgi:hypothetical protein